MKVKDMHLRKESDEGRVFIRIRGGRAVQTEPYEWSRDPIDGRSVMEVLTPVRLWSFDRR
jgi:hypothetical protein